MRKPRQTVSAVAEFLCSPAAVWRVLTREQSYKDWFGFPDPRDLVFVDPDFTVGAKLSFKGLPTLVVTSLLTERELTFADGFRRFSFHIEPIEEGAAVSVTVDIFSETPESGMDVRRFCTDTLRALKRAAGVAGRAAAVSEPEDEISSRVTVPEFLRRVFAGYRLPVAARQSGKSDKIYSAIIDGTKASVTISKRALLFSILLSIFFFVSIGVSLSFQRSDIVPSSGLSLFESEGVSKYISTLIRVGDGKPDVEHMMSCQGERVVKSDNTVEFKYSSFARLPDGEPAERISVIYDAYGQVRMFAYADAKQSAGKLFREPHNRKLKEGLQYYDLYDRNIRLSPSMNLYEVEEAVGLPVSSYFVEKKGEYLKTTLFFGEFYAGDIFETNYKSQIVVILDEQEGTTSVTYYNPIKKDDALPLEELSREIRPQYAALDDYLYDRFAYERMFLLEDVTPAQAEILLSAAGNRIAVRPSEEEPEDEDGQGEETYGYGSGEPADEENPPEEIKPRIDIFAYGLSSPFEQRDSSGRTYPRYNYIVEYKDSVSSVIRFRNERLLGYNADTLNHVTAELFYAGMSLDSAAARVGILPSAAEINESVIMLHYGQLISGVDMTAGEYPLTLVFSRIERKMTGSDFYVPETEEDAAEDGDDAE